jgi:hypothetical protein
MRCLAAQPKGYIQRMLLGAAKRFRGQYALKVEDAPQPSDVLYEHLEYGSSKCAAGSCLPAWLLGWLLGWLPGWLLCNSRHCRRSGLHAAQCALAENPT